MADREMVLRFLAFRLTDPAEYSRGDLDAFLRHAMRQLNNAEPEEIEMLINEFDRAMWSAQRIFEEHAFRKRFLSQAYRLPINKALFETISVNLANLSTAELAMLTKGRDLVQAKFMALMEDGKFQQAISVGTGDVEKVRRRFREVKTLFREVTQ
jgi:hypothetical protein